MHGPTLNLHGELEAHKRVGLITWHHFRFAASNDFFLMPIPVAFSPGLPDLAWPGPGSAARQLHSSGREPLVCS